MSAPDEITIAFHFDSDQFMAMRPEGWWAHRRLNSPTRKRFRKAQRMAWRRVGIMAIRCTRVTET